MSTKFDFSYIPPKPYPEYKEQTLFARIRHHFRCWRMQHKVDWCCNCGFDIRDGKRSDLGLIPKDTVVDGDCDVCGRRIDAIPFRISPGTWI